LREKLGKILNFPMDNIRMGNGSSELIYLAGVAILNRDDNIVMSECSFIVSKLVTQIIGCHAKEVPLDDYHHDLDGLLAAIDENTKIVYLDLPMNPIGTSLRREKFDRFMDGLPEDVLLICDEAYHEYAVCGPGGHDRSAGESQPSFCGQQVCTDRGNGCPG
jgi:histidinol-phosphate aminotransferase